MSKATWQGAVLAESNSCVEVEGNQYFPLESTDQQYFRPSNHTSICSWKGTASYFDVVVNGKSNANAAWYYANPSSAAAQIKNRVAFWKGVKVDV